MAFATSPSPPTFNYNQTLVPIFNGEAYDYWSIQIQTLFISQDLWDVIENDYPIPESQEELATWTTTKQKEYKQNKQHDAKTLLFIQQGVSREIFPRIMQAKNAKEAWKTLKNEFKGTNKAAFMARCTGYHFQKHLGELKLHFNWWMLISGDHQVPPALMEEDIFSSLLMTTPE